MRSRKSAAVPAPKLPSLRFHAGKGLFRVTLSRRDHWLGPDRAQAERAYKKLVLEWIARGRAPEAPAAHEIKIIELVDLWLRRFADDYYAAHPGTLSAIEAGLKPFLALFGEDPAAGFGPKALKAYRAMLVTGDAANFKTTKTPLTRKTVNQRILEIRRIFRWGVSEQLIPPAVSQALDSVENLRRGRSAARESAPVGPVLWEHVEETLPHLPRPVRGLVLLCWHTGARIGELVNLRACDINTSCAVWEYRPAGHKNAWRGQQRVVMFGPEAQAVLRDAMARAGLTGPLFSPRDVYAERAECGTVHRRPNQAGNPRKSDRTVGEFYESKGITHAIRRAVEHANKSRAARGLAPMPRWHVHQIRHSFATRVRREHGAELARVALGHSDMAATMIYAEADMQAAASIMLSMG